MVKILLKLLALATVILALKVGIWAYLHTYQVKRADEISYKLDSLLTPIRHQVNTVFIGSSRTAHSFNPAVFDSVTHQQTRSFNHGINALFAPNTFAECRKLLNVEGLPLKTIFLELSFPPTKAYDDPFSRDDLFAEIALKNSDFLRQSHSDPASVQRGTTLYDSYLTQFFMLRNAVHVLASALVRGPQPDYNMTAAGYRYFAPGSLSNRPPAGGRSTSAPDTATRPVQFTQREQFYVDQLMELVRACAEKHVAIYFFLPNRLMEEEKALLPNVYAALPDQNRIAVPFRREYTPPFPADCSDDTQHLNPKSATLYTRFFARAFLQKRKTAKAQ
ncbi:hypothetical protein GCM10027299_04020 [Larkinella ripae]